MDAGAMPFGYCPTRPQPWLHNPQQQAVIYLDTQQATEGDMRLAMSVLCALLLVSMASAGERPRGVGNEASTSHAEIHIVNVQGGSYFFKPDRITARANVPLELKLSKSRGLVPHNLVIEAPEAGVQVKEPLGREPKTIRMTFTRPGEYAFYCSKKTPFGKTHRARGMEGKIVVTE